MTKLLTLLAVSLALAFVIDQRDAQLKHEGIRRKELFVTFILILVLGFFCGLRLWGNDTATYRQMYQQMPLWNDFLVENKYDFASGMFFGALTSLLKTVGLSEQDYLVFYAFATVIPYVLFVRRYSESMLFGVFLMFTTGFYTFSLAAMKQCMATGLCLMALGYALDGKWIRYLLFTGLGMLFHPYAMVYMLVPLMMFKPWGTRTLLYMVLFMVAGFYLDTLLGTMLDITDMMGAEYSEEEFLGEGVNIFRVMVSFVPMILAVLYGKKLFRNTSKAEDLMFNLAMLNALIMFVGLFGTANYFARLANYFLPAQVIVLPWILRKAHPRDQAWLIPLCIIGYTGYFVYENGIYHPFDQYYAHISFWDYISGLN